VTAWLATRPLKLTTWASWLFFSKYPRVGPFWTRQWTMINPLVGPLQFRLEETNRTKAVVHQVVYHTDLQVRSP
jgi:hypothetical protein